MPASKDLKSACLRALGTPKAGRIGVIREGLESGTLLDPDFRSPLVHALTDKSSVFADALADEILPEIRPSLDSLLEQDYGKQPDAIKYRRLRVLHRLNAKAALECARNSVNAKHEKLALESIDTLTQSAQDPQLLMELASGRSIYRSAAAFRALGGIRKAEVIKFLSDHLSSGQGMPHLAIAYHPHKKFADAIQATLRGLIKSIESDKEVPPGIPEHLVLTLKAAAGQGTTVFDDLLTICLARSRDLENLDTDCLLFHHDFIQATAEAIATNPVQSAQRELVRMRHEIGSSNLFYAMCAASHLDEYELYDLFSPHLAAQNVRGRCRGWRCTSRSNSWPCSIVSAIEYVVALARGEKPAGNPIPQQKTLVEKIQSEPRWASAIEDLPFAN